MKRKIEEVEKTESHEKQSNIKRFFGASKVGRKYLISILRVIKWLKLSILISILCIFIAANQNRT